MIKHDQLRHPVCLLWIFLIAGYTRRQAEHGQTLQSGTPSKPTPHTTPDTAALPNGSRLLHLRVKDRHARPADAESRDQARHALNILFLHVVAALFRDLDG